MLLQHFDQDKGKFFSEGYLTKDQANRSAQWPKNADS